jgi:hypothetical protein
MDQSDNLKIVVFVPEDYADAVRDAMVCAGAGKIGDYTYCSFSTKGIGRFKPAKGTQPVIGEIGKLELVPEERIEVVCERKILNEVVVAIRSAHPYEEVALDVYPLEKM